MSKSELLALFSSVARERVAEGGREERAVSVTQSTAKGDMNVHVIADCCQRLVRALAG